MTGDGGALTVEGVRDLRRALVAAGFAFFPEITGRKQSTKEIGTWIGKCGTFDPDETFSGRFGPLLNTALYCRDLYAIDIDVDEPQWVEAIVDAMAACLGLPASVRYRRNSPRMLALYRAPPDAVYAAARGSDGMVEVFSGADQKITAFGLHTNKQGVRSRIVWDGVPGDVRLCDLPLVAAAQIDAFLDSIGDMLGDDTQRISRNRRQGGGAPLRADDLDELVRATGCIPNQGPLDWHAWNRIGMALYGASGGGDIGLLAFFEFTQKNPLTRHRSCTDRWQAYAGSPPSDIGAGTIFWLARQHGYQGDKKKAAARRYDRMLLKGIERNKTKLQTASPHAPGDALSQDSTHV